MTDLEVVVGRVGRPHGVHGEVAVEPRTDDPERRYAPGARLLCRGAPGAPAAAYEVVTVATTRRHQHRLLVRFEEVSDRTAAEPLRGVLLAVVPDPTETPEDPEEFFDHQLRGLRVCGGAGQPVGVVVDVLHPGAQDLLVVARDAGGETLVPFVQALVPEVDLDAGRLVVADLPGLLEPDDRE